MGKLKYTRMGQTPQSFKCCKCKWEGNEEDKENVLIDPEYGITEHRCPKCGHNEFYGLIEKVS